MTKTKPKKRDAHNVAQILSNIEHRVNQEKRGVIGLDAAYLQGKDDGLRISVALLLGSEDRVFTLIDSSHFAQRVDVVEEQTKQDKLAIAD